MSSRLNNLLAQLEAGDLNATEAKELEGLLLLQDKPTAQKYLEHSFVHAAHLKSIDKEKAVSMMEAILLQGDQIKPRPSTHRIHFLKTTWFRYAAAVILLLGIGGYLLWKESGEIPAFVGNDKGKVVMSGAFSNNKVILTLASGKKIELDNNNKIPLLVKEEPVFDPSEAGQKPGVASYNTITTPKGSQYQLILPDGTKAWLNAASSIKFPTTFTGSTRKVEVTGETFFEVSVNKTAPFVVTTKGTEVQVLGTSFNINAYEDEAAIKTTLVEGAVKVNNTLLQPGQAYAAGRVTDDVDIDQILAWKNNLFYFKGADIKTVMRQLSRWYNVEVEYRGEVNDIFYVKMSRNSTVADVLKVLETTGGVKFRIEGNKIIVE